MHSSFLKFQMKTIEIHFIKHILSIVSFFYLFFWLCQFSYFLYWCRRAIWQEKNMHHKTTLLGIYGKSSSFYTTKPVLYNFNNFFNKFSKNWNWRTTPNVWKNRHMEPAILSRLKDDILAFASQQVYNKELLYIIILRINIMAQQNDQECLVQLDRHVRLLTPGGDYDP